MSDLTATNCGCGSSCGSNLLGGSSCIWIILILLFCGGGCGNGIGGLIGGNNGCGCGCGSEANNGGCDCIIWIILILLLCGNNSTGC